MTDFPVEGSIMPGKMAPPWQLWDVISIVSPSFEGVIEGTPYTADTMPPSVYTLAAIDCRPLASG